MRKIKWLIWALMIVVTLTMYAVWLGSYQPQKIVQCQAICKQTIKS